MVEVTWTARARKDLDGISSYISESSPYYAQQTEWAILERSLILEKQPMIGHMVAETGDPSVREIGQGNYRIIYWIKNPKRVIIIAIVHGKRRLTRSSVNVRKHPR